MTGETSTIQRYITDMPIAILILRYIFQVKSLFVLILAPVFLFIFIEIFYRVEPSYRPYELEEYHEKIWDYMVFNVVLYVVITVILTIIKLIYRVEW